MTGAFVHRSSLRLLVGILSIPAFRTIAMTFVYCVAIAMVDVTVTSHASVTVIVLVTATVPVIVTVSIMQGKGTGSRGLVRAPCRRALQTS